jgi:hypothetical protein
VTFSISTSSVAFLACSALAPTLIGASAEALQAETLQVVNRVNAAESQRESDVRKVTCTRHGLPADEHMDHVLESDAKS